MNDSIMDGKDLYVIASDPYKIPISLGFNLREYVK